MSCVGRFPNNKMLTAVGDGLASRLANLENNGVNATGNIFLSQLMEIIAAFPFSEAR